MSVPNNPAVKAGDTIYIGGTPPIDESGAIVAPGDPAAQTRRIIARLDTLLQRGGLFLENLVFVTIYLKNLDDYGKMNEAYAASLIAPYPARKVIQAPMTLEGMVVEMTAVASIHPREILA